MQAPNLLYLEPMFFFLGTYIFSFFACLNLEPIYVYFKSFTQLWNLYILLEPFICWFIIPFSKELCNIMAGISYFFIDGRINFPIYIYIGFPWRGETDGQMDGKAWLYCWKSWFILLEEHGYIAFIFENLSCSPGRTHFART